MRRLLVPLLFAALLTSCDGSAAGGPIGGTVIIGAPADADALITPLTASIQGRVAGDLLFDRLAEIGPGLNVNGDGGFVPRLAQRWNWSADSLAITFSLDPAARWHDGTPVRAADVAFGLAVIRDPSNGSNLVTDVATVDSISTPDSASATVHFKRRGAEQFYVATQIVPLPSHLLAALDSGTLRTSPAASAPVGSGRFKFVAWEPKVRLELAAVEDHYRGRPRLDRIVFSITQTPATGLARIWAGESDVWEPLTPNDLAEAARHAHVRVMMGPGYDYGYFAFNFRDPKNHDRPHPLFADRALRRALTMAVDRHALTKAIFDSLAYVAMGPFARVQPTADTTIAQIPFDRAAAAAALDSLGWRLGAADSIRRKGTRRLSFDVIIPTSSAVRNRAAVLIQDQLKQVGAELRINAMEFGAFRTEQIAGRFDATIGGWRTTPSPSGIRGTWGSDALTGGSTQNAGDYASAAFDSAVVQALEAIDPAERRAHMRRAYQIIVDDAPALWLYEIRNAAAVHRRLNVPAWRSEAWWINLADWSVDPAQRLPRDARATTP